jgi:hypothetical protein
MTTLARCLAVVLMLAPAVSLAAQPGRTDGPEGSEFGKGGYRRPGTGRLQLSLDIGAPFTPDATASEKSGTQMMAGFNLGYGPDDWYVVEVSGIYDMQLKRTLIEAGPRFRMISWPVAFCLGFKAGPVFRASTARFAVSPEASLETFVSDQFILALRYAVDVPIGEKLVTHRAFLSLGMRF